MLCSYRMKKICLVLLWVIGQGCILEDRIIAFVYLRAELRCVRFGVVVIILIGWAGGFLVCYAS